WPAPRPGLFERGRAACGGPVGGSRPPPPPGTHHRGTLLPHRSEPSAAVVPLEGTMYTAELVPERGGMPWSDEDVSALHAVPPPVALAPPGRPFVGRERELATLQAELAAAAEGGGRLVLLTGEAGIGKTRTAQALAAAARHRGFDVLWASAAEDDTAEHALWAEVLREWIALRRFGPTEPSIDPAS